MKEFIQSLLILTALLNSTTGAVVMVYSQVGETITLSVSSDGTDKSKTYVYWYFGESESNNLVISLNPHGGPKFYNDGGWKDRVSISEYSLVIKGVQEQDFTDTFTCVIKEHVTPITTKNYKLSKITVSMKPETSVLAGESPSLACTVQSPQNNAQPQIHWLNPQGEKRANGGDLTVHQVTGQDNGEWTCVVTSGGKKSYAKISVTVLDLSPAPLYPQYTSLSRSARLSAPCSIPAHLSWDNFKAKGLQGGHWSFVPGLSPGDRQRLFTLSVGEKLTWKVEQETGLGASDPAKKDLSLSKKGVTEADRGEYVCALEFKNRVTLERSIRVEVLEILSSSGLEIPAGQQVNLTCSLGHPLRDGLQVKWIPPKPWCLPSLGPDPHPAHLTIPEVVDGDCGRWKCELWRNKTRLTSVDITLKIAPMSVWLLVTICGATVIFILLLILTVILLRRRRQRKMTPRHPKHRFCQCKNPKPKGFHRS
ncbi:CD4-1 molecule [Centroberyx gerrardi]